MTRTKSVTPPGASRLKSLPVALAAELVARGWSIRECERRAGLPNDALGKIVDGRKPNPGVRTLGRVLTALGLPWAWLDAL